MKTRARFLSAVRASVSALTIGLALIGSREAFAQSPPDFFFEPPGPETWQTPSKQVRIRVCDNEDTIPDMDFTAEWNGQQVSGTYDHTNWFCPFDNSLILNLTAVPGENVLEATAIDGGGPTTDLSSFYYGAWITPRPPATSSIRGPAAGVAFEFTVRNTTSIQRTYSFTSHCPNSTIHSCSVPGGQKTIAAGADSSVFVTATTTSNGSTGTLALKALNPSTQEIMDSAGVFLTIVTPTMSVTPHVSTTSAPAGVLKTVTFQASNLPGTVNVSYKAYCPPSWGCSVLGNPSSIGPPQSTVSLSFVPQTGSQQTLHLAVFQNGLIANRDSGGVTVTVTANNTVTFSPSSANVSKPQQVPTTHPFGLQSTSQTPQTFNLFVTQCTNMTGCSVNTPVAAVFGSNGSVTASFTPGAAPTQGTMVIKAEQVGNPTNFATATLTVTPTGTISNYLVTDFSINNYDNVRSDLCEASCFAVRTAISTVPYISLDQPRSVTLAYNSDAVAVRPIVHADVKVIPGSPTAVEYSLEAKDSLLAAITFVNGETKLRYFTPQLPHDTLVRLSGQFDAKHLSTGVYPIRLVITAKFSTGQTETQTFDTKFLVINERKSYVAKGWSIAGLSRLRDYGPAGALIVDGTGNATYFVGCGSGCYTSPAGDFTRLSSSTATGSLVFMREYPDSSRAEYDNLGFLLRVISRTLTDTTSFVYDGQGRLERITDPFRKNGTTHLYTQITYLTQGIRFIDEPGTGVTQSGGRRTVISVNSTDSTLREWAEPGTVSILTKFRYNASQLLERLINPRSDTTRFVYTALTMKADSIISPHFLKYPALSAADSARLRTHVKPWQVASVPLTATATTPFTPGRSGKITGQVKESGGQITTFTPDRWGQPLVITELAGNPLQRVTTITRQSPTGLALSIVSHTGAVDQFNYNWAIGLPTTVTLAGQNPTTILYGQFAQVSSVSGPGQPTRQFVLGSRGRVEQAKIVAASTYTTQYGYDTRYRVLSTTDPGGHQTTFTYDPVFGNLQSTTAPGSRTTTVKFDGYGRDSTVVAMTLPERTLLYDPLNRVLQEILAAGAGAGQATTGYSYGDKMNLTQVTDAENNVYQYVFNALGAVTQHTDPYGAVEKSLYDEQGRLSAWESRIAGDMVFQTYDDLHRPREKRVQRGSTIMRRDSLSYATNGLWIAGENSASRDTIYLDATGWTTSVATRLATNWSQRVLRTYSKLNSRLDSVHVTYPGTIAATGRKYVWDGTTGALTAARANGQGVSFTLDNELLPSSVSMPGGVAAGLGSISIHQPYRQKYNTAPLDASFWRNLNYDQMGRVDIQYALNGPNITQRNFVYDGRGRVTSVRDSTLVWNGTVCEGTALQDEGGTLCAGAPIPVFSGDRDSLAYSAVGNVTHVTMPLVSGSPGYTRNRLMSWPRPGGGALSYVVDAAGFRQRVNKGTTPWTFYRWTPDGLLDTVRVGAGSNVVRRIKYDYNAFGELVRKSIDGSVDRHFLWDRGNLLAELNGTLTARRSEYAHLPGLDAPFAMLTGATAVTENLTVQRDALGNVLGLTRLDGTVQTGNLRTSEWGALFTGPTTNDTTTMRLRWKGLMYEADSTQLYYVRARWYDPQSRRFISEDPIGLEGGINPFTFAANDPVNVSDPLGLEPCNAAEIFAGYGTIYVEEVGWTCILIGGGQVLPGVKVIGQGGWPSAFSENFGNSCARGGRCGNSGGDPGISIPLANGTTGMIGDVRWKNIGQTADISVFLDSRGLVGVRIEAMGIQVYVDGYPDPIVTQAAYIPRTGEIDVRGRISWIGTKFRLSGTIDSHLVLDLGFPLGRRLFRP